MALEDIEHEVEAEVDHIEAAIIAEGKRIRALAEEEALKIRKSRLVGELEDIEHKLAELLGHASVAEVAPTPEEVSEEKPSDEVEETEEAPAADSETDDEDEDDSKS